MFYLVISILSSTLIVLIFKYTERLNVPIFSMVVLNYFAAAALGFASNATKFSWSSVLYAEWLFLAVLIGLLFVIMFYTIGYATRKVGVAVTSVATKMSVVLPVLFSIFFYSEAAGFIKIIGIALAVPAVIFTVYKKQGKAHGQQVGMRLLLLPLFLFIGTGTIDVILKYTQASFITDEVSSLFSAILFSTAAIAGVIGALVGKQPLKSYFSAKVLISGLLLGTVNFGSLYFLILALNSNSLDSSVVFGINNTGIILVSVLLAPVLFAEKLSTINWLGVMLCAIAIMFLAIA